LVERSIDDQLRSEKLLDVNESSTLVIRPRTEPAFTRSGDTSGPLWLLRLQMKSSRAWGHDAMKNFYADEQGQGLVEYALILAIIAIAVIVAMIFLRDQISNIFSNIGNNLT